MPASPGRYRSLGLFSVFAAAFAALAAGAYPWLAPRDAGDLALSALTLYPAHPPGYPLYALAGRAWLELLPYGSAAYRLNLLSAACAAGAAALLFAWARRRAGAPCAALLAAAFALSGPVRKFGGLQEMYAAQALFAAALLAAADMAPGRRRGAWWGLLAGLGLVNHPSLLFLLPGLALLARPRRDELAPAAAFALLGLCVEAFLAVRLGSVSEAWRAATRAEYGTFELFSGLAAPLSARSAGALALHWLREAGPLPALALALAALRGSDRLTAAGLWLSAAGTAAFVLASRFDVSGWVARSVLESAFVSSGLLLCALAALGLSALPPRARLAAAALTALWSASTGAREGFHRDDFAARDYIESLRRLVPPGTAVVAAGDTALFGLRYAEAERPASRSRRILSTFDQETEAEYLLGRPIEGVFSEALVQRRTKGGLGEKGWELVGLRSSRALENGESYAHDVRLSFAFAHYHSAALLEKAGKPAGEHPVWAAAFDPEDYHLEVAR